MSRFIKLAVVLSSATAAACPGPNTTTAPARSATAKPAEKPAAEQPVEKPAEKAAEAAPEPEYEEVRLMTRAGPKWMKVEKKKPRVAKQPAKPVATRSK